MIRLVVRLQLLTMRNERGASLIEYALLMGLIAIVAIAAITFVGSETSANFEPLNDPGVWRP
ncbi:MAG: Flp family type IVb pilin [Acidobacteria bacterium]|nr:Flp family type IVb pilin [Acidobacteriota bacterium]MCH8985298.1 Flp family type IVb pilin [Acidobacteriota bacterium]